MSEFRNIDNGNDGIGQERQPIDGENNIVENDAIIRQEEEEVLVPSSRNNIKGTGKRKMYSDIWNFFEQRVTEDGKDVAWCNYCGKPFTGDSKNGTSNLWNHIKGCEELEWEFQEGYKFDQTKSEIKLAEMIELLGYPLSVVEHIGFRKFVRSLQPKFVIPTKEKLENDAIIREEEEEEALVPSSRNNIKGKMYSKVWDSFDRQVTEDGKHVAVCHYCDKQLSGDTKNGTSNLKNHIKRCKKRPWEFQEGYKFYQLESEIKLVEMILLHEYPLSVVEHVGFRNFVSSLQPIFVMPTNDGSEDFDIEFICIEVWYDRMKQIREKLKNLKCRVNITMDIVESCGGNLCYLCLAAYVLNLSSIYNRQTESFFPERVILDLVKLDKTDTPDDLIWNIERTLSSDWELEYENLFSIVSAYPTANSKLVNELHSALATSKKSPLFISEDTFHLQSCTHVIDFIIEGCTKVLQKVIDKVHEDVKWLKASPELLQHFNDQRNSTLTDIDHLLHGNSISHILRIARRYRAACVFLNIPFPFSAEWTYVKYIRRCLKVCYEIRKLPSGKLHPIASLYFPKLCDLYILLIDCCSSTTPLIASMAPEMLDKLKIYWDSNNLILSMASVLDPTQKMEYIKFYFPHIYGEEESRMKIEDVRMNMKILYEKYQQRANESEPLIMSHIENSNPYLSSTSQSALVISESSPYIPLSKRRMRLKDFLSQRLSKCPNQRSALDRYLDQAIMPECSFEEVLSWWRGESHNSLALFLMASDILGIPVSTTLVKKTESLIKRSKDTLLDQYYLNKLLHIQDSTREDYIGAGKSLVELSTVAAFEEEDSVTSDTENYMKDDNSDTDEFYIFSKDLVRSLFEVED